MKDCVCHEHNPGCVCKTTPSKPLENWHIVATVMAMVGVIVAFCLIAP